MGVALSVLGAASATDAEAATWSRTTRGAHAVDAPTGWRVHLDDNGDTDVTGATRVVGQKQTSAFVVALRSRPLAAQQTVEAVARDYLAGWDEHATVTATSHGTNYFAMEARSGTRRAIGVRVSIRPGGTRVATLGLVEADRSYFQERADYYAWHVLDRIIVSRVTSTIASAPAPTLRFEPYRSSQWNLQVPIGAVVKEQETAVIISPRGAGTAPYAVVFVRAPGDVDVAENILPRFLDSIGTDVRLLTPGTASATEQLYSLHANNAEHRVFVQTKPDSQGKLLVVMVATTDNLWKLGLPALARTMADRAGGATLPAERLRRSLGSTGKARNGALVGTWEGTTSHGRADGIIVQMRVFTLTFHFDDDGGYRLAYRFQSGAFLENEVRSRDTGRYEFDGATLTLRPSKRIVDDQGTVTTYTKGFKAHRFSVERGRRAGEITVSGPGLVWFGMKPTWSYEVDDVSMLDLAPTADTASQ